MKKGLIFGLIAVLSAAFLIIGCSQGTDSGSTSIQIGGRLVDIEVQTEADLLAALNNPDYQIIAVTGTFTYAGAGKLSTVTEIPADKTVVLYTALIPSDEFEIKGTLVVEGNGVLTADDSSRVRVTDGNIEVINGTIEVDSVVDIHGRDIEIQILGTGKAYFADGTLQINEPLATLSDVNTAFSWVPKGTLIVDEVTAPVKPSDLTKIPTTAVRRLTITNELVADPASPDTATSLTVPVGMTFETDSEPLDSLETLTVLGTLTTDASLIKLETLTVAGELTASAAKLNRLESLTVSGTLTAAAAELNNVTDLKVSGSITAASATYDQVTSLVVDSSFNAGAVNFRSLQSLKVNKGGEFTTTGSIGSNALTDPPAITIEIEAGEGLIPAGIVTVASINNLATSVVAGVLTAGGFTPHAADSTLDAAAGGVINGVTFPAATSGGVTLAVDTVTVTESYTVPRNGTIDIDTTTLIIPTTKVLTFAPFASASGTGAIIARGSTSGGEIAIDGVEHYTTSITGVAGDDFRPAVAALIADTGKLTAVNLNTFFASGTAKPYLGVATVTITGTSATAVTFGFNASTTVDLTAATSAITGEDAATITALTFTAATPSITDGSWATGTAKYVILTVTPAAGTKFVNNGLINATDVPAFNIGVQTART